MVEVIAVSALLLLFFVIILVAGRRRFFIGKGAYGELNIARRLARLPDEYHVFNDVYLKQGNRSVQIDHLVISKYGIFVIETKNYSGKIYGSEHAEHWMQYFPNGENYQLYNPIRQNQSHTWAARKVLGVTPTSVFPVVVFLSGVDLRLTVESPVLYASQLTDYIKSHTSVAFTHEEVYRLVERLKGALVTEPDKKSQHIHSVHQSVAEKELLVVNLTCPRCRGQLVRRKGKYGDFYGCSNYPHCKFTAPV